MDRLRILLIDDHDLFRAGLRSLLHQEAGLEIVGEARDARAGYEEDERTRPDLALVDFRLPGTDGIAAARELHRRNPDRKLAMLSGVASDPFTVADALRAGASGFFLKSQPADEIVAGLRQLAAGETYVAPEFAARIESNGSHGNKPLGFEQLSRREREVFGQLVAGKSNREVAAELCISIKTVETHREHILKKLDLHSVVGLVRFAATHNLLD